MSQPKRPEESAAGRMLPDLGPLLDAVGIDVEQTAARGGGSWQERREIAKLRNVHTRKAVQVTLRCIALGRWVAQSTPSDPAWADLTAAIDEFHAVFFHGQGDVGPRMVALAKVAQFAEQALRWRYIRAAARVVVGSPTASDKLLLRTARAKDLRHAADEPLGNEPTLEKARALTEGRSGVEDFPERECAETMLFSLRRDGVGRVVSARKVETLDIAIKLLREWPSKGGASLEFRSSKRAGLGGKWSLAAALMTQLGLGKVEPEALRQAWLAWLKKQQRRTKLYRDNL